MQANLVRSSQPTDNARSPEQPTSKIVISATFTAEPLADSLTFWMRELAFPSALEFAPYNQVFQELFDPNSLTSQNAEKTGINLMLIRFEDWCRFHQHDGDEKASPIAEVKRNTQDLIKALRSAAARSAATFVVCICPSSVEQIGEAEEAVTLTDLEAEIAAELSDVSNLSLITPANFAAYPVQQIYDEERDRLGHIPFTPEFFAALGTVIARRIYTLRRSPYKVIVLDCDNTLWQGIVGEDGLDGIEFSAPYQAFHQFLKQQQEAGMLLCLCSKNNEADVMEVFENRSDMGLKLGDIVSWRINWLPKSENIKALAKELNLGLDSFVFLDDNPVECSEVKLACPDVLSLQFPPAERIEQFIAHIWALDHLKVTSEDKKRTDLYKQNIARSKLEEESTSIHEFLASLNLQIDIHPPREEQLPRVAQLTQRTNQFNCTTVRRTEADVRQFAEQGLDCRVVEVRDRFGDYGLVGVVIFRIEADAVVVDTFLLSCRVLGRGVEHQMLRSLGEVAVEHDLALVKVPFYPTKKNVPARNFLNSIGQDFRQALPDAAEGACEFHFPSDYTATLTYNPADSKPSEAASAATANRPSDSRPTTNPTTATSGDAPTPTNGAENSANGQPAPTGTPTAAAPESKSDLFQRVADRLYSPALVLAQVMSRSAEPRPDLGYAPEAPRNPIESKLVTLWSNLLNIEPIGVTDNYFDLGGTSLLAVELFVAIEQEFGLKLPLTTVVEAPTIADLAQRINQPENAAAGRSLVLLQAGAAEPALFLVHDGDGETLLYRNLAQRLRPSRAVYGIQPLSRDGFPMLHTRIPEMAADYIEQIRTVQPHGPYLLGGMCAGGVISYEMARQLEQAGETVAFVGLMDAADGQAQRKVGRLTSQRMNRLAAALEESGEAPFHQRIQQTLGVLLTKIRGVVDYEVRHRYQSAMNKRRFQRLRACLDRQRDLPADLSRISVRTIYDLAEQDYRPDAPFGGELVLLRATAGEGADEPYVFKFEDPLLGWAQRTQQEVQVFEVQGGHSSMLQEPHVEDMAAKINQYLEQKLAALAPVAST